MSETKVNIVDAAAVLGFGWESQVLADMPASRVKLFRIDPAGLPSEMHNSYPEALFVVEGQLDLVLGEKVVPMKAGDFQVIPAGIPHSIKPGGNGTIFLIDPE